MTGKLRGFWAFVQAVIFLLSIPKVFAILFTRSICLKGIKDFIEKENTCSIPLNDIKQRLTERAGSSICKSEIFCNVYFGYNSNEDDYYFWLKAARIRIFNKFSGKFQSRTRAINCIDSFYDKERTLFINVYGGCEENSWCGENEECLMGYYGTLGEIGTCACVNDTIRVNSICRKVDIKMDEPCTFDIQCSKAGYNRVCDKATSTCLCVAGFTEINGHCIRTDLGVNQTCWYDEQCNGTANSSVCRKNICVCMDEHYFRNGTCEPSKNELPTDDADTSKGSQPFQEHGDSSVAQNVAAVIGGFVLGILTCLVVVYVIHIRSRRRKHTQNVEAKLVNNINYKKEPSTNIQKDTRNLQQAKISHVRPIIKVDPEYSNTYQVKSETNDIYNHLNEKIEDDTIDIYDHALTGATGKSNEEEYTHLSR